MEWVVLVIAVLAVSAALILLARRIRRRGATGQAVAAAVAAFDEGYRSTGYDTFVEMQARDERGGSTRSEDL